MKIINIYYLKQDKYSVEIEKIKNKLISINLVSHNLNFSIYQVSYCLRICTNSLKWYSEHQKAIQSCILLTSPLKLKLTPSQDQPLLLLSNLDQLLLIKSIKYVKVSKPKSTDFRPIKMKFLIKLNRSKTI